MVKTDELTIEYSYSGLQGGRFLLRVKEWTEQIKKWSHTSDLDLVELSCEELNLGDAKAKYYLDTLFEIEGAHPPWIAEVFGLDIWQLFHRALAHAPDDFDVIVTLPRDKAAQFEATWDRLLEAEQEEQEEFERELREPLLSDDDEKDLWGDSELL